MTLLCRVQASGHASDGEQLKLFKDAGADIGNLLAAAPVPGPTASQNHDNTHMGLFGGSYSAMQSWNVASPAPIFSPASTAALHTSMIPDDARPGTSNLFLPSNLISAPLVSFPISNSGAIAVPDAGHGTSPFTPSRLTPL